MPYIERLGTASLLSSVHRVRPLAPPHIEPSSPLEALRMDSGAGEGARCGKPLLEEIVRRERRK